MVAMKQFMSSMLGWFYLGALVVFLGILTPSAYGGSTADFLLGEEEPAEEPLAGEILYSGTFSGTTIPSQIDTNGDGDTGVFSLATINSTLGQSTGEGAFEEVLVDPPTGACPEGNLELTIAVGRFVTRFPNGEDTLFVEVLTRTDCFDPATGAYSGNDTGIWIGGTGRFAGASGPFEQSYTGQLFVSDPVTFQSFSYFTGEFSGTLIIPDN